jgi:hypothetical protein
MSTPARTLETTAAAAASEVRAGGLAWTDRWMLIAIGLVVVLVTLPRLRRFALRDNELDAMRMLRALAAQPAMPLARGEQRTLAALLARDTGLQKRLDDLEFLSDGRVRRHGYLFDLCVTDAGQARLRAWPWRHAQTGLGAFVWTPETGLLGHGNADGRFSGPERAPEPGTRAALDWLRIPRR